MNRLTPIICGREIINCKESYTQDKIQQMFLKLGQLEDIEEELGIDLITLFKVLKGNIYSLHPETGKICLIVLPICYYCGNQWVIGCRSMEWNDKENSCDSWDCLPKDYGKTWALTKEELL